MTFETSQPWLTDEEEGRLDNALDALREAERELNAGGFQVDAASVYQLRMMLAERIGMYGLEARVEAMREAVA